MKFSSWLIDKKINGINVTVEFTIKEYWDFAEEVLENNDLQRKRVKATGKTYQLLARDLKSGCIMPPIILAINDEITAENQQIIENAVEKGFIEDAHEGVLESAIKAAIANKSLLILDGLQRTFTIQDCLKELSNQEGNLTNFLDLKIRTEVYVGLDRTGILYRMLTLNTGQTPMSLRHQIEIIYQDYANSQRLIGEEITLIKEAEDKRVEELGQYQLSSAADMYYAYSTGSPNSYTKQTISTILKESEFLEGFNTKTSADLPTVLLSYHRFVKKLNELFPQWELYTDLSPEEKEKKLDKLEAMPFGKNLINIIKKVQVMAGFAAAVSNLQEIGFIRNFESLDEKIDSLKIGVGLDNPLDWLIECLEEIRSDSKRVGESQRAFFRFFFKTLLNSSLESYLKVSDSLIFAKQTYDSVFMK